MTVDDATRDAVVIERVVDAPPELVWRLWTDPDHFAAWYGPDGATIPVATLDVRVGGTRRVCMEVQTPDGPMRMWFVGEHLEVVEPELLVYTESIADEDGTPVPGHPPATEVRVQLHGEGGGTRMVVTHVGIAAGSPGAAGWAMALDKLVARATTAG
jgi:uncharacterized protein YndB with AHSA1/START domain